ncbi:hypothetical protein ACRS5A_18380 [Acinetobacter baumannii]|uniref:hypothetical protein n=1 Tax=Acinetobacter baumannii TaxID=470 RepID=UPI003EE3ABE4
MIYKCQECGKRFFFLSNYAAHTADHVQAKREARFERAKQERLQVNRERYTGSKTSLNNEFGCPMTGEVITEQEFHENIYFTYSTTAKYAEAVTPYFS